MACRIGKNDFQKRVIESELPVLVDFYSDSCIACKKLVPVLGNIEDAYEGRLSVVKVNTNFETELSETYDVFANPTLLLFQQGKEKDRKSGALSEKELTKWIEQYV